MRSYLIISFILINLSISIDILSSLVSQGMSKFGINYLPDLERQEAESLRGKLFIILRDIVEAKNISNITKLNISESCLNVINRYLLGHIDEKNSSNISYIISDYHMIKLLDDSSKNRNLMDTYDKCMIKTYKLAKNLSNIDNKYFTKNEKKYSTFLVLSIDKFRNSTPKLNILELDFGYFLQGYCLPQGYNIDGEYCNDNEYMKLIQFFNQEFDGILNLNDSKLNAFTIRINPDDLEYDPLYLKVIECLPFILFLLPFFFMICMICGGLIIKKIKKICKKHKKEKNNNNEYDDEQILIEKDKNDIEKNNFKEFFKCFSFKENSNELFNFDINSTKFNNDSGLNYTRGLIGLLIISVTIGFTFIALYNSPKKLSSRTQLNDFFRNNWLFYIIIMTGIRYSPRIILSCSGYILAYKYVSYLNKNFVGNSESILKTSFKFISYQLHKFFLLIILLFFERYSSYNLYNFFFRGESPMFKYFYINILQKPDFLLLLRSLTIFGYIIPNEEEQYRNGHHLLLYFWLPFNEILFFLLGVLIITFGFKYKWRIDIIILCLVPILYISKIVYSYLISSYYKNDKFPLDECYSTLFYVFFNYGRDMINPLFNLSYYLIGIFFGLINYTIQKGINDLYTKDSKNNFQIYESKGEKIEDLLSKKDDENKGNNNSLSFEDDSLSNENSVEEGEKLKKEGQYSEEIEKMPFLIIPIKFVLWHRDRNKGFIYIICIVSSIFFLFVVCLIYIFNWFYDDLNKVFTDWFVNLIYRIDIELFVIFIQWFSFLAILGTNIRSMGFINHIIWIIISRPYFSFILVINTMLLFIFYFEETLIEINYMSTFIYSLIGILFTILFMSLFYIIYELPLKRLIRLLYKRHSYKKYKKEMETEDIKENNCSEESGSDDEIIDDSNLLKKDEEKDVEIIENNDKIKNE